MAARNFLYKVQDNSVYVKNIVSDVNFTMSAGGSDISVGGKLRMRRDEVIRIQLVAFGLMEVGRLEFTKDYVLIVNKYHKTYAKEDYSKASFLKENGLDFYTLQALFWNQLYLPGAQKVSDADLDKFHVERAAPVSISLSKGSFAYKWLANEGTALIENVSVDYSSAAHGSTNVGCSYSDFVSLGSKKFPTNIRLSLQTTAIKPAKTLTLKLALSEIETTDKWEARTSLSDKYRQITVEEMMKAIMSIGK